MQSKKQTMKIYKNVLSALGNNPLTFYPLTENEADIIGLESETPFARVVHSKNAEKDIDLYIIDGKIFMSLSCLQESEEEITFDDAFGIGNGPLISKEKRPVELDD